MNILKKLLVACALVAGLAAGAHAQTNLATPNPAPAVDRIQAAEDVRAALNKLQESGS